ncbi:MAG: acyl-CoA reductase [Myxococcota bacterium]|nr:acyl-CoA reductase [Myxococcota bacterium]
MTPDEVRARLAALRETGERLRARPAGETLAALARVLDAWSDPRSEWRRELARTLPAATGFSPEVVAEGLRLALADWTGDALRELVARELGDELPEGLPTTALLLAGSIPMPSLLSIVAPLVLRSPVLVKSAVRDRVTAPLVARSLARSDPLLGACVEVVAFRGSDRECGAALLEADCVVATGSDETVAAVRSTMAGRGRLVEHGHRLSVAALGSVGPGLPDVARQLALDVCLWDQLGCLSPVSVYARDADAVAEALAQALAESARSLPRGRVDAGAATLFAHERDAAELRAAAGGKVRVLAADDGAWAVVREADAAPRPAPLHRFVRVQPVDGAAELLDALRPLARHLAGVALDGFGPRQPALAAALAELGASWICAPGRLQAPPLGWRRDGREVLGPLVK